MATLNYEGHFGLTASPFQLSPDPTFLFASEQSKGAIESISEAIAQRKGFVVLTGEVGTGKTLLLRCLFDVWEREQISFAYFIGPRLSTIDFLSYVAFELGITVTEPSNAAEPSKGTLLRGLYGFLLEQFEKGSTTVLIIDEAHLMPRSVLEEIRVLANFETAQQKLIQIVLAGQPELDKKLDSTELRSLKQRISVRCQLQPLREAEVRRYIEQRLEIAGAGERAETIFPAETVKAIHRYSTGIPRLVNNICDQAMIVTCSRQLDVVPAEVIHSVAAHFRLGPASAPKTPEKRITANSEGERAEVEKHVPTVTAIDTAGVRNPSAESRPRVPVPGLPNPSGVPLPSASIAATSISGTSIASASMTLPTPGLQLETLTATHAAEETMRATNKRDSQPKPIREEREDRPVSPAFRLRTAFTLQETDRDEAQTVAVAGGASPSAAKTTPDVSGERPAKTRRWLRPGLLLVGAGALVPLSVAGGLFVARHRIDSVAAAQPVFNAKAHAAPISAAVVQPAPPSFIAKTQSPAASAPPAAMPAHAVSAAPSATAKSPEKTPKEPEHAMAMASVAQRAGSFTRPVMKSMKASPAIEPPALSGSGMNSGANLSSANPSPMAPMAPTTPMAAMEKSPLAGITGTANEPVAPAAPSNVVSDVVPQVISHPAPEYPFLARQTHTQGDVAIEVVINRAGNVANATVITGPPVFREAALQAVRQWKYQPLGGQAMMAKTLVTLRFRM